MRRVITVLFAIFAMLPNLRGQSLSFSGSKLNVIPITPAPASSLSAVYLAYSTSGLQVEFESTSDQKPEWYSYGTDGTVIAKPVNTVIFNGKKSSITLTGGDIGLIIIHNGRRYYYWISDYSKAPLSIKSIEDSGLSDCSATRLQIEGNIPPLEYLDPSGRVFKIARLLSISYITQKPNNDFTAFEKLRITADLEAEQGLINITPPVYSNTTFSLTGDKFLQQWGLPVQSADSPEIYPIAVDAIATATVDSQDLELSEGITADISAPADLILSATGTEALIHPEWQIASDPDFSDIITRRNELYTDFHLDRSGLAYIRFLGYNAEGTCSVEVGPFIARVGESSLRIPNTFFPGAENGASSWRVTSKGLNTFRCEIFDRYGNRLFSTDNPEAAWDGTSGGKIVAPGVYFYVIKAEGADGVVYNKNGHINVLRQVPARIR